MRGFIYISRPSFLHSMDARLKMLLFIALQLSLNLGSTGPGWPYLIMGLVLLLTLAGIGKIPMVGLLLPIPSLLFLYLLILALRVGGIPLESPLFFPAILETIAYLGVINTMLGFAALQLACTRIHDMKEAILWFLSPLPRRLHASLGMLIGLVLLFIPLLLDNAAQRRMAVQNRRPHKRPAPLMAIRTMGLEIHGLISEAMGFAKEVEIALQARGLDTIPLAKPPYEPIETGGHGKFYDFVFLGLVMGSFWLIPTLLNYLLGLVSIQVPRG